MDELYFKHLVVTDITSMTDHDFIRRMNTCSGRNGVYEGRNDQNEGLSTKIFHPIK